MDTTLVFVTKCKLTLCNSFFRDMRLTLSSHRKGVLQSYFVGCSRKTGEKITVKEFHLPHYPADDTSIVSEVLFLSKLSHPGLPAFKEMFLTDTSVYVITDYIDQQRLSHCISTLNVTDARNIFKQLAQIVQYCHEKKIILRDLSPSNIVVKKLAAPSAFEVKIADLSMAVEANSKDALADHPLFEWPLVKFSSPEMILSQPYTIASDIWSLGVVLFAMLSRGKLPFEHNLDHILVRDISTAHYDFDCDEVWEDVSERAKSLVEQMLKVPINERPTAKECLKNHWVVIGE